MILSGDLLIVNSGMVLVTRYGALSVIICADVKFKKEAEKSVKSVTVIILTIIFLGQYTSFHHQFTSTF
ncbi:MAG: hypothetical protein NVSMB45_12550 [Ginsengibacter sp.]